MILECSQGQDHLLVGLGDCWAHPNLQLSKSKMSPHECAYLGIPQAVLPIRVPHAETTASAPEIPVDFKAQDQSRDPLLNYPQQSC